MEFNTQTNFINAICTVSAATDILYCYGARNREWTLEGTDWHSGKSAFHYTIGKDHRYNDWLGGLSSLLPMAQ